VHVRMGMGEFLYLYGCVFWGFLGKDDLSVYLRESEEYGFLRYTPPLTWGLLIWE
jgi:hypothetical protein